MWSQRSRIEVEEKWNKGKIEQVVVVLALRDWRTEKSRESWREKEVVGELSIPGFKMGPESPILQCHMTKTHNSSTDIGPNDPHAPPSHHFLSLASFLFLAVISSL